MEQSQQSSSSSLVLPSIRRGVASHQTIQDAEPVVLFTKSSKNDDEINNHDDDDDKIDGGGDGDDHEVIVVLGAGDGIGGGLKSDNNKVNVEPCGVCNQNQARYTCPKCNVPYCSVKCYKSHNTNNTTTTNTSNGDNGTTTTTTTTTTEISECTERFYRDRVTQVLQLETKERKDETLRILNRTYHQAAEDSLAAAAVELNHNSTTIPQDELIKLLKILEDGGDEEEISRMFSKEPRLRLAINQAIETGELHDWLLDPWHPWWRPELSSTGDGVGGEEEEEEEEEGEADLDVEEEKQEGGTASSCLKTIDERLLQIPSFSKLRPKNNNNKNSSSPLPLPQLQYNLIDILYSIVTTLRLYHGVKNATQDKETSISSANTLIHTSKVLSSDARFECLEEVMMSCITTTTTTTTADSSSNNNYTATTPWDVLATDVALICQNPRTVARALFEAIDIIGNVAAANNNKKKNDELVLLSAADNNNNNNTNNNNQEEEGASHHQMRRIRKKIEYYLSWSKERLNNALSTISLDLKEWIAHWKHS